MKRVCADLHTQTKLHAAASSDYEIKKRGTKSRSEIQNQEATTKPKKLDTEFRSEKRNKEARHEIKNPSTTNQRSEKNHARALHEGSGALEGRGRCLCRVYGRRGGWEEG